MARSTPQRSARALAGTQFGVITRPQLRALAYSDEAIDHRIETGRLFVVHRGVSALGRRELTREGEWMAAVLACGERAALSHESAAELWELKSVKRPTTPIQISSLADSCSREGIRVRRRVRLDTTTHQGIRTTTPAQTLIDLARTWPAHRLEAAINEADKRSLVHPRALHTAARKAGREGANLRKLLDRQTLVLADTDLERRFLRIIRRAGLPMPDTQVRFGRFRVDFHWPDLNLVVESDGGSYHRTAAQQTKDRKLEQHLLMRGLTIVRFTHAQVVYESEYVGETLGAVIRRCS
jgi:very-short-patch-repair endonuclease